MDELDFEPEHDVLDAPDLYALVLRGQVEATFTCAELQDLLRGARSLRQAERERQQKSPASGAGGALSRALSGPASEIEVLVLKGAGGARPGGRPTRLGASARRLAPVLPTWR